MAEFLKLILENIRKVDNLMSQTNDWPLNQSQCEHLAKQLAHIKVILVNEESILAHLGTEYQPVLRALFRFTKEAEIFVEESCSYDRCFGRAITCTCGCEGFLDVVHELLWHTTLLQAILSQTKKNGRILTFEEGKTKNFGEYGTVTHYLDWRSTMSAIAVKDQKRLRERLERFMQEENLEAEISYQIIYLSQRLGVLTMNEAISVMDIKISREEIRRGGHGVVYKTMWLGMNCAQKVFEGVDNLNFKQDAANLQALSHPNIVQLFFSITERSECSLVMELMDTDLRTLIESDMREHKTPLSLDVAVDIMLQIAKGMRYLHGKHVAHRDLNAHNILVTRLPFPELRQGGYVIVKLADFGMAKVKGKNLSKVAKKADVHSFGSTCSEILTACIPFKSEVRSEFQTLAPQKGAKRPSLPKDCPSVLSSLLERCWATLPKDRPKFSAIAECLRQLDVSLLTRASIHNILPPISIRLMTSTKESDIKLLQASHICSRSEQGAQTKYMRTASGKRRNDLPNQDKDVELIEEENGLATDEKEDHSVQERQLMSSLSNFITDECNSEGLTEEDRHKILKTSTTLQEVRITSLAAQFENVYSGLHRQEYTSGCGIMEVDVKSAGVVHFEQDQFNTNAKNGVKRTNCTSSQQVLVAVENTMTLQPQSEVGSEPGTNIPQEPNDQEIESVLPPAECPSQLEPLTGETTTTEESYLQVDLMPLELPRAEERLKLLSQSLEYRDVLERSISLEHAPLVRDPVSNEEASLSSIYDDIANSIPDNFEEDGRRWESFSHDLKDSIDWECTFDSDISYINILETIDVSSFNPDVVFQDVGRSWEDLPTDIRELVLGKLKFEELFKAKILSGSVKKCIEESDTLHCLLGEARAREGLFTSLHFFIKNGAWHWSGYDLMSNKWRRLPPLTCLPSPEADLFKEYLFSGGGGLLCVNVSKSLEKEKLVVCNPLTGKTKELPPMLSRRNPVLMHLLPNPATKSFKVIVAGSSGMEGQKHLSQKTEVFDSLTEKWTATGDIPGPEFALNEYQTGVLKDGILYCIGFLEDGSGKGVLAYDVEKGVWVLNWKCPLPPPICRMSPHSITQLAECDGEVYLFFEREHGRNVEHHINKLEIASSNRAGTWKNVVKDAKTGGRGLLVYPEYTCVAHGDGKMCIFNTIEHTGVVYDIHRWGESEPLSSPTPIPSSEGFHSLNPLSFTFEPSFKGQLLSERSGEYGRSFSPSNGGGK